MKWYLFVLLLTTLSVIIFLPEANALTTYRGQNYSDTSYGTGKHLWQGGLPQWVYDFTAGNGTKFFTPYKINNGTNFLTYESQEGTWSYDKSRCGIGLFPNGRYNGTAVISNNYNILYNNTQNGWKQIDLVNNATCNLSYIVNATYFHVIENQTHAGTGSFIKTWTKTPGNPLKLSMSFKNLNATWNKTRFAFDEGIYVPKTDRLGNNTFDFSLFNGTTLTKQWLTQFGAKTMKFGNTITYNIGNIFNYVDHAAVTWNGTKGHIIIYFENVTNITLPNGTISIDPTYGWTNGTMKTIAMSGNTNTCIGPSDQYYSYAGGASGLGQIEIPTYLTPCFFNNIRWDVGAIPTTATIQDVKIKFWGQGVLPGDNGLFACDYLPMITHDQNIASAGTIGHDAENNFPAHYIHNDLACTVTSSTNGTTLDLGNNAVFDLKRQLGLAWFQVAMTPTSPWPSHQAGGCCQRFGEEIDPTRVQLQVIYNSAVLNKAHVYQSDGTTPVSGATVIDTNSSKSGSLITNSTGVTPNFIFAGGLFQNFTVKENNNFITWKQYNLNSTSNSTYITFTTNAKRIDCPFTTSNPDMILYTNDTNGHRINTFASPTCFSNNTIKWSTTFTANGQNSNLYSSQVGLKIINTTAYGTSPQYLLVNGTNVPITFNPSTNFTTSNSFTVGTGLQTRVLQFSLLLKTGLLPSAPVLTGTPTSNTMIKLTWTKPTSNGTQPLIGFQIIRNGTILVNNTATPNTLTYTDTVAAMHQQTYQVAGWSNLGLGAYSNIITVSPFLPTKANVYINYTIIGDMIGVTPRVQMIQGSPPPHVYNVTLYNQTRKAESNLTNTIVPQGTTKYFGIFYNGELVIPNNQNYTIKMIISNATGANQTFTSNFTGLVSRAYKPNYTQALDTTQGLVNYTLNRSPDQLGVKLAVNRDKGGGLWKIECLYQTASQIAITPQQPSGGTWQNHTQIGYLNDTHRMSNTFENVYISCYNDGLLFTTTSYANATLLAGINYFNTTFSGFIGVPVGVFFIALVAGLATGRTAPTMVVIVLAIAAIMASIGFFVISQPVWGLCLIAAASCLFAGKKYL